MQPTPLGLRLLARDRRLRRAPATADACHEHVRETLERLRRLGLRPREHDRATVVHRTGHLDVARHTHLGLAADDALDVVVADPDAAVRTVEHEHGALAL